MTKTPTMLALGYWPLLTTQQPIQDTNNPASILKHIEHLMDAGTADACLWTIRNDAPQPILVIQDGDAIYNHMCWWSDQNPSEWFDVVIDEYQHDNGLCYVVAITPKHHKSIKRIQTRYLQEREEFINERNITMIFRSIHFSTNRSQTYQTIAGKIPEDKLNIGIIDDKNFNPNNPAATDDQHIHWLTLDRNVESAVVNHLINDLKTAVH